MPPQTDAELGSATASETSTETSENTSTISESTSTASETAGETGANGEAKETAKTGLTLPASLKPPAKTGRFQERISSLVQSRKTAEEENRRLKEELAQLRNGTASAPKNGNALTKKDDGPPSPDDFETYAEYVDAMVDYKMEQKEKARQAEQSQTSEARERQDKTDAFHQHAAPLAEQYGEGFWDAITDPSLPVTDAMADAVMELGPLAPYTMLWLAANREASLKMAKLSPRQATMAIGKLADHLERELKKPATDGAQDATVVNGNTALAPALNGGRPAPTAVPTVRGGSPASTLGEEPNDKDDPHTWLQKETNRLRRINPHARFYGAR